MRTRRARTLDRLGHGSGLMALLAATGTFASVGLPGGTAAASPSKPGALLAACLKLGRSEPGGQWVLRASQGGTSTLLTFRGGRKDGKESGTVTSGRHLGREQAVLKGSVLYIKGDEYALDRWSFTAKAARDEASKWISLRRSVPSQTAEYEMLSEPFTVGAVMAVLGIKGIVAETPSRTVEGIAVIGLEGQSSVDSGSTEVIYVRASGPPLPVHVVIESGDFSGTITFSHWGTVPAVTMPSSPVPFQSGWVTQ